MILNKKFIDGIFLILFLTNVIVASSVKQDFNTVSVSVGDVGLPASGTASTPNFGTGPSLNLSGTEQGATEIFSVSTSGKFEEKKKEKPVEKKPEVKKPEEKKPEVKKPEEKKKPVEKKPEEKKKPVIPKNEAREKVKPTDKPSQTDCQGKCFYDTVENMVVFLRKSIHIYKERCSIDDKPLIKKLVDIAIKVGKVGAFKHKEVPEEVIEEVTSLTKHKDFAFIHHVEKFVKAVKSNHNTKVLRKTISVAIRDELDDIVLTKNFPHFLRQDIWRLINTHRILNKLVEKYGENEKGCIPSNWVDILHVYDLISDPNFKSVIRVSSLECKLKTTEIIVKPEDFEFSGIGASFFGNENWVELDGKPLTVFTGFVNNKKYYEYQLVPGKDTVIHRIIAGDDVAEIDSESRCADYFWTLMSIQKDCDRFTISLSTHFLASNKRSFVENVVFANQIENTRFVFNDKITWGRQSYRNFKYSFDKEILLLSSSLNANSLKKLVESSRCVKGCIYSVKGRCVKCKPHLFALDGKCVKKCPSNTYVSKKRHCKPCHKNCAKCTGKLNGQCKKCVDPFYFNLGFCNVKCPENKFPDSDRVCQKCTKHCVSCRDLTNCAKCKQGTWLLKGKCVKDCGVGLWKDYNPNHCQPCPLPCASCVSPRQCVRCKPHFFLKHGRKCVPNCGNNYYASKKSNSCKPCQQYCQKCKGPKKCDKCISGFLITPNKQCVKKCSIGFVQVIGACVQCADSNCDVCLPFNIGKCVTCNSKTYNKHGKCVKECGEGYYANTERKCKKCVENCKLCTKDKCIQCYGNRVIFENKKCLNKCYPGYIPVNGHCVKCKQPNHCRRCLANNLEVCTKCYRPNILFNGKCIKSCPTKFFKKHNKCQPCIKGCDVCTNNYNCKVCSKDWFLKNNLCVDCCGAGYVEVKGICKRCKTEKCNLCHVNDISTCARCIEGYFLHNNKCIKKCPPHTYPTPGFTCAQCKPHCSACKSEKDCQRCDLGFFVQDNDCVSFCDDGYVAIDGICVACTNPDCKKCSALNRKECTQCDAGEFLFEGECYKKCPKHTYVHQNRCRRCVKPCEDCRDAVHCETCIKGFLLTEEERCIDHCTDGTAKVGNKCKKCKVAHCDKCKSKNLAHCIKCTKPFALLGANCVPRCPTGYRNSRGICKPCLPGCAVCLNKHSCITCNKKLFLKDGNKCVQKCGDGYVKNGKNCKKCSVKCKKCKRTDAGHCTKCYFKYFLAGANCVQKCPDGTFKNYIKRTCQKCPMNKCRYCRGGKTCKRCFPGYVLENNKCHIPPCSLGTTLDKLRQTCVPCEIANCATCPFGNLKKCTTCKNGFWLYKYGNVKCVTNCLVGTFKNPKTKSCSKCSKNCRICVNKKTCLKCSVGTYLFNGRCRHNCPTGYTKFQGKCRPCETKRCGTCHKAEICNECIKPFKLNGNTCVLKCPIGKYAKKGKCHKCGLFCESCKNHKICKVCKKGKILDEGKCVEECPVNTAVVNGVCVRCKGDKRCAKCCSKNLKKCLLCQKNLLLKKNTCVEKCGPRYFIKNRKCKKCSKRCVLCVSPNKCLRCEKGAYLLFNRCVRFCPRGFYASNGKCLRCRQKACVRCNADKCLVCQKKYLNEDGRCVANCSKGWFTIDQIKCNKCSKRCLQCVTKSTCTICKDGFKLKNGKCVKTCGSGWVAVANKCVECGVDCVVCSSKNVKECVECKKGTFLFKATCIKNCPPTTYVNKKKNKCKFCLKNCLSCTNKRTCKKCIPPFRVSPNTKKCLRKCPDGYKKGLIRCVPCKDKYCKTCNSDIKKCQVCRIPYLLLGYKCVKACPTGFYRNNHGTRCKKCPIECKSCVSKNVCKTCNFGFFLKKGKCVHECGIGYQKVGQECVECKTKFCSVCSKNGDKCDKCIIGKVLDDNKCEDSCEEGQFNDNGICESCIDHCAECSNKDSCFECKKGYLLQSGKCQLRCNTFFVEQKRKCVRCHSPKCVDCDNVTLKTCRVCASEFALKNNKCVTDCGKGYFRFQISPKNAICKPCQPKCSRCIHSNQCKRCVKGTFLKEKQCITNCGKGWATKGRKCVKCEENCDLCDAYKPSICFRCNLSTYLKNGQCVKFCGDRFYAAPSGNCVPCSGPNCLVCAPQGTCKVCVKNFFILRGKCIEKCPLGMVPNRNAHCVQCKTPNCARCNPSKLTQCVECKSSFLLLPNGTCATKCPKAHFAYNNSRCVPCSGNCLKCKNAVQCVKCKNGLNLDKNGRCVDKCPKNFVAIKGKCKKCKDSKCFKCSAKNVAKCLVCPVGYYIHNHRCVKKCPKGTFPLINWCVKCAKGCKACSLLGCKKCVKPLIVDNGFCTKKCRDGFVEIKGVCTKCLNPRAKTCKKNKKTPIECKSNYFLWLKECVDNCPAGTYPNDKRTCQKCGNDCNKCGSLTECKKCNKLSLFKGQCVEKCPLKTVKLFGICVQCKSHDCNVCRASQPGYCITCEDNLFNYNGECVTSCPDGFYDDEERNCHRCDSKCAVCTNSTTCKKCIDPFSLKDHHCVKDCDDGEVKKEGQCLKCNDKNCKVCSGRDLNVCLECKNGFLIGGKCVAKCPNTYRGDIESKRCVNCPKYCRTCDKEKCLDCQIGYYKSASNNKICVNCEKANTVLVTLKSGLKVCDVCKLKHCLKCANGTTKKCDVCHISQVKINGICLSKCPRGYFRKGQSCIKCSEGCGHCVNAESCVDCKKPYLLFLNRCIKKCPKGWVSNGKRCLKCVQNNCNKCLVNKRAHCIKCDKKSFIYNHTCYHKCPRETYPKDRECKKCGAHCARCSSKKCLECEFPYNLKAGVCVKKCGFGYVPVKAKCVPCSDVNCKICSTQDKCVKCKANFFFNVNNKCVEDCGAEYYKNLITQRCEGCSLGCEQCLDNKSCEVCEKGLLLHLGECVGKCPGGFTEVDKKCVKCEQDDCLKCVEGEPKHCLLCNKTFLSRQRCVKKCPRGTFPSNGRCDTCDKKCDKCTSKTNCVNCKKEFVNNNGHCESNCTVGKIAINGRCVPCSDTNCAACSGTVSNCVDCKSPYVLFDKQCRTHCPKGRYVSKDRVCRKCTEGCVSCQDKDSCDTCENGWYKYLGECVKICPPRTFENCNTHTCQKCNEACEQCTDATSSSCSKCNFGYFLNENACVGPNNCRAGTYADVVERKCVRCELPFCQECASRNICKTCIRGFTPEAGKCVESKTFIEVYGDSAKLFSEATFNLIRPTEIKSFEGDLKGTGVGSDSVSYSFWLRRITKTRINTTLFRTKSKSAALNIKFSIVKAKKGTRCQLKVGKAKFQFKGCGYRSLYAWNHFSFTFKRKGTKGKLHVYRKISKSGKVIRHKFPISISENFLNKWSILDFNSNADKTATIGGAFELSGFYVYDYSLTFTEVQAARKTAPAQRDYLCSAFTNKCTLCQGGVKPVKGRCLNSSYISVKNGLQKLSKRQIVKIRSKVTKRLDSTTYAFTTWFYARQQNVEIASFEYVYSFQEKLISASIKEGSLVVQVGGEIVETEWSVSAKKWYFLLISISDKSVNIQLADRFDYSKTKVFDCDVSAQILTEDAIFTSGTESFFRGSFYDLRLYIDSIPNFKEVRKNLPSPKNCQKLNGSLRCVQCSEGFELSKGQCVAEGLDANSLLIAKTSIWNKEGLTVEVPTYYTSKDKFTFSFWLRKKIHSKSSKKGKRFHLFRIVTQDSKVHNGVSEKLVSDYVSKYYVTDDSTSKAYSFKHTYTNEVYEFINVLVAFNSKKQRISYEIKDGKSKTRRIVKKLSGKVKAFVFGDEDGIEMNNEFANGYVYPRTYSLSLNKVIREKTAPKDCDPGCDKCDYLTGLCNVCKSGVSKKTGLLVCSNFLIGFKTAYLYNIKDLSNSRADRFTVFLKDHFVKDVNSLEYSVIGYYRFFDLKIVKKNKSTAFEIFKLANRYQPIFSSPSNNLLTLRARHSKKTGKLIYEFIYNDIDKIRKHRLPIQVLEEDWILLHATINVIKRRIDYSIIVDKTGKKFVGHIKLNRFPEKLQERSSLTVFETDVTNNNKLINGNFYHFYMSPNLRWNVNMIDRYRKAYPTQPDPKCKGCKKCIVDYTNESKVCLICKPGYELLNAVCKSKIKATYNLLADGSVRKFVRPSSDIFSPSVDSDKTALIFHIRRNFVPIKSETRDILRAGNFRIALHSNQGGASSLTFLIEGSENSISANGLDRNLLKDYSWYTIIVNYSSEILWVFIKSGKKVLYHKKITSKVEIDLGRKISFDDLNGEVSINLPHFIYKNFYQNALLAPSKYCGQDCNACINGKCADCQYGKSKLNKYKCKNKKINIASFELSNDSKSSNIFSLKKYLTSLRPLRSRNWTVQFGFKIEEKDFSKLSRKSLFKIINHDGEVTPTGFHVSDELFSLDFHKKDRFFARVSNRYYAAKLHSSKGFETSAFRSTPTNRGYFVIISFNGKRNEFSVVIHNSKTSYIQQTFKYKGSAENISQRTHLIFGEQLNNILFYKIKFSYERAAHKRNLLRKAYAGNPSFQSVCESSSRLSCFKCAKGSYLNNGICAPTKGAQSLFIRNVLPINNLEGGNVHASKHFKVTNQFTFNFWFRRTSYSTDPYGISRVTLTSGDKTSKFIDVYNFDNTLVADLYNANGSIANQVKIYNFYTKEDGFKWVYISVSVDIKENILNVYQFNRKSKDNKFESNDSKEDLSVDLNDSSYFSVDVGYKYSKLTQTYSFELSSITYFKNYLTVGTSSIERYRTPIPNQCGQVCKNGCNDKGLCLPGSVLNSEVNVGDIYAENPKLQGKTGAKVWAKIPLYRKFKQALKVNTGSQVWLDYLVSFQMDIADLYKSNYATNSRYLINIHNFNSEEIDCLHLTDKINDNWVKFGIISAENRDDALRFYLGGNKPNSYVKTTDFTFKRGFLQTKKLINIQVHVNANRRRAKLNISIDQLTAFFEINMEYVPETLNLNTNIYNNPAITNFRINVHNPRFNYDTYFNIVKAGHNKTKFRSRLCGNSCKRCAIAQKYIICQKCAKGFSLVGFSCLRSKR